MAGSLQVSKVIRKVRKRLGISQEALSRRLNATKGAIQHWERGRNKPDLARLLALRQICPSGPERKELDALIRRIQGEIAPLAGGFTFPASGRGVAPLVGAGMGSPVEVQKENVRLKKQTDRLQAQLEKRAEQLRILEGLATDLQRQVAELKADKGAKAEVAVPQADQ
ncbi:MAG TPA: helix-turn-helix transcriptional regulator [Terriglobia bacterium]|jgi:transcriptional regulator with XRE-family HTH domain|nr:helix-turn-helix transcriptional regulator [Terriglobia bacterium]